MKQLFFGCIGLLSLIAQAQRPCEFTTDVKDSLGSYKSTKEYLVYEKNFGGNSSYIFYSILITDGTPVLQVQLLEKSSDFIKAKCFDKNSKIYLQLNNNKIVTLLHTNDESCGSMLRDDKGINNRILSGYFMFRKEDYEDLKKSELSFIRIKFGAESADYMMRKAFKSELDGLIYEPESYFLNYFHCLEAKP
ncbi:MAG: hypothetical protein U0X58_01845 [Flavobacteriaceae bacterium]